MHLVGFPSLTLSLLFLPLHNPVATSTSSNLTTHFPSHTNNNHPHSLKKVMDLSAASYLYGLNPIEADKTPRTFTRKRHQIDNIQNFTAISDKTFCQKCLVYFKMFCCGGFKYLPDIHCKILKNVN